MIRYKFIATLIYDDERTGNKRGMVFHPKGFYYQKKKIVLVGDVHTDHSIRLSFPIESIEIQILR